MTRPEDPGASAAAGVNRAATGWPWKRVAWLVGFVAAAGVLFFVRPIDVRAVSRQLSLAHPAWIVAAVLANLLSLVLMAVQWGVFVPRPRRIPWTMLWECASLGMAAMNTLPFGGGHALAIGWLASRGGLGMEGALSLMGLEQLCEAAAKVGVLLLALAFAPLPAQLQQAAWVLGGILLAGSAVLVWLVRHPAPFRRGSDGLARWISHLAVARDPRVLPSALALSVGMKAAQMAGLYAVERSLGVELPLGTLPLLLCAVTIATMVSVAPGNLVVYEAAAYSAFRWLGVPEDQAVALALVQHACFLAPMALPGYGLMLWRAIVLRR